MPSQFLSSVENNFTRGLITESTGLNFPENAATDCDNCLFTLTGQTQRRLGIDLEENFTAGPADRSGAITSYRWSNAGGDGSTVLVVVQTGTFLNFYNASASTASNPMSGHRLVSSVDMSTFIPLSGGSFDSSQECQYADGNGYLFVFHPNCDPIYCTYNSGTVTGSPITVEIRDFYGIPEALNPNARPTTLSPEHQYNLINQGWTSGDPWSCISGFTNIPSTGSVTFNVGTVTGITLGDQVTGWSLPQYYYPGGPIIVDSKKCTFGGTVTAYSAPNLTINVTSGTNLNTGQYQFNIFAVNKGYINTWHTAEGNYPSNADVWWYFKNTSGVFDPATTQPNVSLSAGTAPQGRNILNAFNLDRASATGIADLTPIITTQRPSTGAWFQSRVWYTGLNDSQQPSGDAPFYTWSENIYFSQVCLGSATNFGNCYQVNDPTSENLFDLLPTDGGVISIPGSGRIYKLFPIQNGMLVFAANGVWFITGSQGIGFAANDYTVTKLSNIESISSSSFVDVMGLPYFWNEEGIYQVIPQQNGGGLTVNPITVGTILGYYNNIPKECKKYVKGAYHPIDYVIQWTYRSDDPTDVTSRYNFDKILNYNVYNKAFYPYSVDSSDTSINGIIYITTPGGSDAIDSVFKYIASYSSNGASLMSFADEHDESYTDWASTTPKDFISYFVTGYKLRGQSLTKFQPQYVQVWSNTNGSTTAYQIQGIWDFAGSEDTGRVTVLQNVKVFNPKYNIIHRRHKIRGNGYALQFKITSQQGLPFDIAGWAVVDTVNQGT
jgi:hypothetical protein